MKEYEIVYTETCEYTDYVEAHSKAEALEKWNEQVEMYGIDFENGNTVDSKVVVNLER